MTGPRHRNGARRQPAIAFEFPRDHASHPEFKIEWWYYTGNVQTADGRRFGFQVTFFRVGVDTGAGRTRPHGRFAICSWRTWP